MKGKIHRPHDLWQLNIRCADRRYTLAAEGIRAVPDVLTGGTKTHHLAVVGADHNRFGRMTFRTFDTNDLARVA